VLGDRCEGPCYFGARMFIFAGHRHKMDKLISSEYEQTSNSSGISKEHINISIYTCVVCSKISRDVSIKSISA
jgi:hypothetical protein